MLETSARLLRLLGLLQARSFWSGADLAERLEVTERTVRRDVDRLRSLGYPVHSSAGVAGGYQLGSGAALPPLLLDDDEALAVALGLRTTAAGTVLGMEEAAVRALAKLEQVLPARLRRQVKALHDAVAPLTMKGPAVRPELLTALAAACRGNEQLRFAYCDGKGRPSERHVEPHGVVSAAARWYLVAWDLAREDFRSFRVDRIDGDCKRTGKRFVPRAVPGGDVARYVARSVAVEPYAHRARVVLHAPAEQLAARVSPLAATVQPLDEQRCVLEAGGPALDRLLLHIAGLGIPFEVQEPPELVEAARELARRFAGAVKEGGKKGGRARGL